jgi:hypothetical protein
MDPIDAEAEVEEREKAATKRMIRVRRLDMTETTMCSNSTGN